MDPTRHIFIPETMSELANELLQFQWFFEEESVVNTENSASPWLSDIVAIPLKDLQIKIDEIDSVVHLLTDDGFLIKRSEVQNLVALINTSIQALVKIRPLLNHYKSSRKAKKDVNALLENYLYFRAEINRWLQYLDIPTCQQQVGTDASRSLAFVLEFADFRCARNIRRSPRRSMWRKRLPVWLLTLRQELSFVAGVMGSQMTLPFVC